MKLYWRLLKYLKPHLHHFIWAVIFVNIFAGMSGVSLTMVIPFTQIILENNSVTPQAVQQPIDFSKLVHLDRETFIRIIGGATKVEILERFCVFLILIFLIKNIFLYMWSYLIIKVEQGVVRDIRNDLYEHYQKLPLEFFHGNKTGELISRITNDIMLVRGAIANGLSELIKNVMQTIVFAVLVFVASWKMALATIIIMPPAILMISWFGKKVKSNSKITQEQMGFITTTLQETVSGIRVVKAFAMEKFEISGPTCP